MYCISCVKATIVASSLMVRPSSLNFVRGWTVRARDDGRRSPDRLFRASTCCRREDSFQVVPLPLLGRSLSFLDEEDTVVLRCLPICLSISREQLGQETRGQLLLLVLLFSSSVRSPSPVISLVQFGDRTGQGKERELGEREERGAVPLARKVVPSFRRSFSHRSRIGRKNLASIVQRNGRNKRLELSSMEGCFDNNGAPVGERERERERI